MAARASELATTCPIASPRHQHERETVGVGEVHVEARVAEVDARVDELAGCTESF